MAFGIAIQNPYRWSGCARRSFRCRTVTAESISEKPNPISSKWLPLAVGRTRFLISAWIRHFSCLLCAFGNCLVSCNRFYAVLLLLSSLVNWKLYCCVTAFDFGACQSIRWMRCNWFWFCNSKPKCRSLLYLLLQDFLLGLARKLILYLSYLMMILVYLEERLVIQIERNLPKVENPKVENPYIYSMVREGWTSNKPYLQRVYLAMCQIVENIYA